MKVLLVLGKTIIFSQANADPRWTTIAKGDFLEHDSHLYQVTKRCFLTTTRPTDLYIYIKEVKAR